MKTFACLVLALAIPLTSLCSDRERGPRNTVLVYEPDRIQQNGAVIDSVVRARLELAPIPSYREPTEVRVSVVAEQDSDGWFAWIQGPAIDRMLIEMLGDYPVHIPGPIRSGDTVAFALPLRILSVGEVSCDVVIKDVRRTVYPNGLEGHTSRFETGITLRVTPDGNFDGMSNRGEGGTYFVGLGAKPELLNQGVFLAHHMLPMGARGPLVQRSEIPELYRQNYLFEVTAKATVCDSERKQLCVDVSVVPLLSYEGGLALEVGTTSGLRVTQVSESVRQPVIRDQPYSFQVAVACDSSGCGLMSIAPHTPNVDFFTASDFIVSDHKYLRATLLIAVGVDDDGSIAYITDQAPNDLYRRILKRGGDPESVDPRFSTAAGCFGQRIKLQNSYWSTDHKSVLDYYTQ